MENIIQEYHPEEVEMEPTEAPTWMNESSKIFNIRMFQEWQAQRKNWRLSKALEEDKTLERCLGQVLSPMNNIEEGQEKLRRRKLFQKTGKLEQSWSLMRECKDYLEKNDERWKKRTREENN